MNFVLLYSVTMLVSFAITWGIIQFESVHAHFTADHDFQGAQKFHARAVPRIGGVGLFLAMAVLVACAHGLRFPASRNLLLLWGASVPAFTIGFAEDVTKRISPFWRLLGVMVAAAVGAVLLDARLGRLDVVGLNMMMRFTALSFAFTLVAVAGVTNAVNIIDGYNGLAGGVACLIFTGLAFVAWKVGDHMVMCASIGMICALVGFLFWNFPRGLIFLGDGGAYFVGFMIGELSVLLLVHNPAVPVFYPLLLCSYPVFETLFSIYRKKFIRGQSPGQPDGVHMHMLIYKRLVRMYAYAKDANAKTQRNSITSIYLWGLAAGTTLPAMVFWDSPIVLCLLFAIFCIVYLWLYGGLVKFHHPDWLQLGPEGESASMVELPVKKERSAPMR